MLYVVETRLRTYIICAQKSTMFAHISKLTFAHILCWKHHYIRFAALNVYHLLILTGEHLILIWRLVPWLENTSYWSSASCLDWRTPHTHLAPRALTGEHLVLIWRLVRFFSRLWQFWLRFSMSPEYALFDRFVCCLSDGASELDKINKSAKIYRML